MTPTSCFPTLDEIMKLVLAGRHNAGRAIWQTLPDEFRSKVMQYTLDAHKSNHIDSCPDVTMDSPYGIFRFNARRLRELVEVVPKLMSV